VRHNASSATPPSSRSSPAAITAQALSPILQSPIAPKLLGHTVQEKNGLKFEYSPVRTGIQAVAEREGQKTSALLDWAFGAGVRGITPVGSFDGAYFEHRVSWYTAGDRAGLTMGHSAAAPVSSTIEASRWMVSLSYLRHRRGGRCVLPFKKRYASSRYCDAGSLRHRADPSGC
jgi:hypothetical protein